MVYTYRFGNFDTFTKQTHWILPDVANEYSVIFLEFVGFKVEQMDLMAMLTPKSLQIIFGF